MGHPAAGKVETPGNGNYNVRIPRHGRPDLAAVGGFLKPSGPPPPPPTTLINKYKGNTFPRGPASLPWPLTSLSGRFLGPRGLRGALAGRQRGCSSGRPSEARPAPGPARRGPRAVTPVGAAAELLPGGPAELR